MISYILICISSYSIVAYFMFLLLSALHQLHHNICVRKIDLIFTPQAASFMYPASLQDFGNHGSPQRFILCRNRQSLYSIISPQFMLCHLFIQLFFLCVPIKLSCLVSVIFSMYAFLVN